MPLRYDLMSGQLPLGEEIDLSDSAPLTDTTPSRRTFQLQARRTGLVEQPQPQHRHVEHARDHPAAPSVTVDGHFFRSRMNSRTLGDREFILHLHHNPWKAA